MCFISAITMSTTCICHRPLDRNRPTCAGNFAQCARLCQRSRAELGCHRLSQGKGRNIEKPLPQKPATGGEYDESSSFLCSHDGLN